MLEPTTSRQVATLIVWNNSHGMAKTDDGGMIELHAEQMAYAPMQQGARIEIFWQNGKVEHWRHLPKIGDSADDVSNAKLADMAGTKFYFQAAQVVKYELFNTMILLLIFTTIWTISYKFDWNTHIALSALVGGIMARLPTWYSLWRSSWVWTAGEQGLVVSKIGQFGMANASGHRFLAWQDIETIEICKTLIFRQPYLWIKPRIPQANIKLAIHLLSPDDQAQTVKIIQNHIQAL